MPTKSIPEVFPYHLKSLKHAVDDEIARILSDEGYTQIFTLIDLRLALGWSACIVGAAGGAYSYTRGFEEGKFWTAASVITHFLLSFLLYMHVTFVEKGTVYQGRRGDDRRLHIVSKADSKTGYKYSLSVNGTQALVMSFGRYFDRHGFFIGQEIFKDDLLNVIKEKQQ